MPTNRQDSRFGSRSGPKGEVQEAPSQRARRVAGRTPAIKSSHPDQISRKHVVRSLTRALPGIGSIKSHVSRMISSVLIVDDFAGKPSSICIRFETSSRPA